MPFPCPCHAPVPWRCVSSDVLLSSVTIFIKPWDCSNRGCRRQFCSLSLWEEVDRVRYICCYQGSRGPPPLGRGRVGVGVRGGKEQNWERVRVPRTCMRFCMQ